VQGQQPTIKNAQQPYPYIAQARQPIIYEYRSPFTVDAQQPYPYIYRNPSIVQAIVQQPHIAQSPGPVPGISQFRQPVNIPNGGYFGGPLAYRSPFTGSYQYIGQVSSQVQAIATPASAQQPVPFRQPVNIPSGGYFGGPIAYRSPGQTPSPYITVTFSNVGNVRGPANSQTASNATGRSPFRTPAQQPNQRSKQSPFTYERQGRSPFTYNYRSPFTYRSPVNAQQPYIADARQPFTYNFASPFTYDHRSPFTYQLPYSTTRPIGPVAKVKGVFVNNAGSVSKVDEVYVNDSGTAEKIHQSVPNAQFLKG